MGRRGAVSVRRRRRRRRQRCRRSSRRVHRVRVCVAAKRVTIAGHAQTHQFNQPKKKKKNNIKKV